MKITISYQPQLLSPPFAYAAVMNIETKDNLILIEFMLEYLGREGLSDKELSVDGFTKDDDFSWKGDIGIQWKEDIESFSHMDFETNPDQETYLHTEVDGQKLGFPKNTEKAELVFQELMQAILEKAEIEAPLFLSCKFQDVLYELKWEFAKRIIQVNNKSSAKWETGRQLLRDIYSVDFDSLKSSQKPTTNSIAVGDGVWYAIKDKSVIRTFQNQISKLSN